MKAFFNQSNKFVSFIYNCYDNAKNTIKSYHSYASSYDAFQSQQQADESNYNTFHVTTVTQDMEDMVIENVPPMKQLKTSLENMIHGITSSFIYLTFTFTNGIRYEKKCLKACFAEKAPVKEMRGFGVDFAPFIERSPELKFKMDSNRINIRDSLLLKDKTTDYTWGFIKEDLSVKFQSTLLPLKPPRGLFKKTCK